MSAGRSVRSSHDRWCCRKRSPNVRRTPGLVSVSQICSLPPDPAAAIVNGSLGEKLVVKSLPMPRSRADTRLILRGLSPSLSTFHTLTWRSVPAVSKHPGICGLISRDVHAPSCATSVYRAASVPLGVSARTSNPCTIPDSSATRNECSFHPFHRTASTSAPIRATTACSAMRASNTRIVLS